MSALASGIVFPHGGRPVRWAATGRSGGVSRPPYASWNLADHVGDDPRSVVDNLDRAAAAVGAVPGRWAVMGAVHGNDVAVVDRPGRVAGVDALVTREADLALVALAADCVPLALIGDDGLTLAAVHCGWRGLVSDVVGATGAVLADLGAAIGQVVIGPSVCGRCYPVPDDRAEAVARAWPGDVAAAALVTCADGQPGIDVSRGVQARLVELGVSPDRITVVPGCTAEDPALFSFRRDGVTGRQGIVVARMGS